MKEIKSTHWSEEQIKIIKDMYAKNLTPDELNVFSLLCKELGLDPIRKQVYAVKRKAKNSKGITEDVMTLQTSIEGYRSIAERTGNHAPGEETIYLYNENKELIGARAYVKKRTQDGTWHNVSAEAYLSEYMATYYDKQSEINKPTQFWAKFPRVMIEKCAEARALRRCFPNELGMLYIKEEMDQSEERSTPQIETICKDEYILTSDQLYKLQNMIGSRTDIADRITKKYGITTLLQIKQKHFDDIIKGIEAINKIENTTNGANHVK